MDWIGNNLYWTNDGHRKTIAVARLEKAAQSRKTLLEGDMSHPRGIVVDPVNGYEANWFFFNDCSINMGLNLLRMRFVES